MIAFDEGFSREWVLQREQIAKANDAGYTAWGMALHGAGTIEGGCYVGRAWMSPSNIAKGIAKIVFDWSDEE